MPFPSTLWSLIIRAGKDSGEERSIALDLLLRRYLPAMKAHLLLRKRLDADAADDLLQGFITDKIVAQNLLATANAGKGKFRSFLLVALDRYRIDVERRCRAQQRHPEGVLLDVQMQNGLAASVLEPCDEFTLVWARTIVDEARHRMQEHCQSLERKNLWIVFTERILRPVEDGAAPRSYEELAGSLRLGSAKEVANLLITAKRLFARMLRSVVAEYVSDDGRIDDEIDDLMRILSQRG